MTVTWPELQQDLGATALRFAGLVGELDPDEQVRASAWTVGETAAHVITALDRWSDAREGTYPYEVGRGASFGTRIAEINQREIEAAPHDSTEVRSAADRWLQPATEPDRRIRIYGLDDAECTIAEATGVLLGELLIHGYDIARSAGVSWPITRRAAIAVIEGALPVLPVLYDGSATGGRSFVVDVRLRGRGRGIALRCTPEALTVSDGSPPDAALHVSASPGPWLLVAYGRRKQWRAVATGQIAAWGRRPWVATRLARLLPPP